MVISTQNAIKIMPKWAQDFPEVRFTDGDRLAEYCRGD